MGANAARPCKPLLKGLNNLVHNIGKKWPGLHVRCEMTSVQKRSGSGSNINAHMT